MNRSVILAALAVAAVYFPIAHQLDASFVPDVPRRADVAVIPRLLRTETPGVFYAHLWLPVWATKATIYENGVSIGAANTVYDDPTRTWIFNGRRWKLVEFNSKGEDARRWLIFAGPSNNTSELR